MKVRGLVTPGRMGAAILMLALPGAAAVAQSVDYGGSIRVGVSNTDNVFLQPAPLDTDETIYQITPSLRLDYENQRVVAIARYQFDWYKYQELSRTDNFHRYDASLTGELVEDTIFVEIGGSRSQSLIDPDGAVPFSTLPISGNLTDRDEYYINPRFERNFGRDITAKASYRKEYVEFEDPASQDNNNEIASFGIENYRAGEGLTWAARYEQRESDYDVSLPFEFKKASAELGFWVNGKTRIFGSGGQESAWDDPVDRSLQDSFWEAGFAYKNGEKLSAEFAAGERSFGSSWRGKLDFTFQRGTLNFSYRESPTTTGFNRFDRGNLLNPDEPDDFLTRPGNSERYISERGQIDLGINFRRTTIQLTAFDESRTGRTRADGTMLSDEDQNGVSANISWQAGARTQFVASGSLTSRSTPTAGEIDLIRGSLGANYQLGSSVTLSLSYNYNEQNPEDSGLSRDYVANVVSFSASYSF